LAGRVWPAAHLRTILYTILATFGAGMVTGCGHANAPCPTPTTLVDRHRSEAEALQENLGRMEDEDASLQEQRDEAIRRIEAAQAAQDSLARASKKRRPR
jgi:hypothetical protein